MSPSDTVFILLAVHTRREELTCELENHYRGRGWKVRRGSDGTVRAAGPGAVTWIGLPVVGEDLEGGLGNRLQALARTRMDGVGARCPLEVLPDEGCAGEVRMLLARLRLDEVVSVYSLVA